MEKRKVKIEEKISRDVLAERLRKMAFDLENGRLDVQSGDKTIALSVPELMPLEIEAKRKETKEKIVIEISWRDLPTPEGGDESLGEGEAKTDAVSLESSCSVETASSGETVGGSSCVAPEPVADVTEAGSTSAPCGEETVSPAGAGEAAAVSSAVESDPVAGESEEPTGQPKPRTGRRRGK